MTFQDLILKLQSYWAKQGCILAQGYDLEVGAGTMNPATFLRVLGPRALEAWRTSSPPGAPPTAASARTPTGSSSTTSSR